MSSVNPNESHQKSGFFSFSECDEIASFYEKLDVPARKTTGVLGGKSYRWYVTDKGQAFSIQCVCGAPTLGFGALTVSSRMSAETPSSRLFRNSSLNHDKSVVKMKSIFGFSTHEFTLPRPDKGR